MTHSDRNYGGSIPRYLAILVAAVLGLSLFPATAMAAHNPDGDDPCEGVPVANEYVDRDEARDVHEASIDCVIYWSIAVGSTDENGDPVYNPRNPVNRGQMSAFIYNAVENAGYDLPDPETAPDAFTDDDGNPFEGTINSLAEADIVNGTTATTYSPGANINRDQMASFMVQAANWAVGDEHPVESDGADRFTDVPESNPHKGNIEAGADAGLFSGVTATTFEPKVDVWRDQMATFLVRLFQYIWGDQAPAPTTVSATADGNTVTGEITGADSATVSGCGLEDEAVTDSDTTTDDDVIEFELTIPADQPAGDCELTFTVTRPNGQQVVRSVTVTVEGSEGQDLSVSPQDAAENEVSASGTSNEGARQYTVTGLDDATEYDIVLFPAENVSVADDGTVTFVDDNENAEAGNDEADRDTGEVDAVIEVVNGSTVTAASEQEANPVNGTISFTIDSTDPDSVVPVVFVDAESDNTVELDENNEPAENEPFGVGGQKTWIPEEADGGAFGPVNVLEVDKDADRFSACDFGADPSPAEGNGGNCFSYYYDSNDTFTIDGVPANMAAFEAALTENDDISGTYSDDPDLSSSFELTDESPTEPLNVDATTESDTEILVEWDEPASGEPDEYVIYRTQVDENDFANQGPPPVFDEATDCPDAQDDDDFDDYTEIGRVPGDATDLEYEDTGLQPDTAYCYTVTAVQDGQESDPADEDGTETETTDNTGDPLIERAVVDETGGTTDTVLDTGDIIELEFSEDMDEATIETSGRFVATDNDGDRFQIDCAGTSVTCTVYDSNGATAPAQTDIVRIEITGAVTAASDGDGYTDLNSGTGDDTANYPATIQATTNYKDEAGNETDVENSPDRVINTGTLDADATAV